MSSFAFRSLNIKKDISVSFYSLCVSDRKRTEMCRCGVVARSRGAAVPRWRIADEAHVKNTDVFYYHFLFHPSRSRINVP